jgi:hypothetical protein
MQVNIANLQTVPMEPDNLGYQISGQVIFNQPEGTTAPETLWVVAAAYSADGTVVGLRRWEAPADQLASPVFFSFAVYSVGAPIDRVEVFPEARASN